MKNKKLKQFQDQIFKQIASHVKRYTLLNLPEIKKIFSPRKLYGSSLYWLLLCPNIEKKEKFYLDKNSLNSLAVMEIFIKANLIHQTIEEVDPQFSSPTMIPGEQVVLLKNTRKILLGDMLIATTINAINSLSDIRTRKRFYSRAQVIFLQNIKGLLSKKKKSIKTESEGLRNWVILLPQLNYQSHQNYQSREWYRQKMKSIIKLLEGSLLASEIGEIDKKIDRFSNSLRKKLDTEQVNTLTMWLHREILDTVQLNGGLPLSKESYYQIGKNSIFQLLS